MAKNIPGLEGYRRGRDQLARYRAAMFPRGMVVRVEDESFDGLGITAVDGECPVDHVPVLVESGNVWWYAIENCRLFPSPPPRWIREVLEKRKKQ